MYEKVQYMKIQGPSHVAGTKIKLSYLTCRQKLTMLNDDLKLSRSTP